MRTYTIKESEVSRTWYLVDASGKTLGRLATKIAETLTGKNKPTFSPHLDMGDGVIVINADKVVLTGKKMTDKLYYRHSQYPGGLKTERAVDLMKRKPEAILEIAVKGMLPNNKLRTPRLNRLKIYTGAAHPHQAQNPVALEIK